VRRSFKDTVLRNIGPTRIPYQWAAILAFPTFWSACGAAAGVESVPNLQVLIRYVFCEWLALCFLVMPSLTALGLHIVVFSNRIAGFPRSSAMNVMVTYLLTILIAGTWFVLWYALTVFNSWANPLPIVLWDLLLMVITVVLYPELRCYTGGRSSQRLNTQESARKSFLRSAHSSKQSRNQSIPQQTVQQFPDERQDGRSTNVRTGFDDLYILDPKEESDERPPGARGIDI